MNKPSTSDYSTRRQSTSIPIDFEPAVAQEALHPVFCVECGLKMQSDYKHCPACGTGSVI